MQCGNIQNIGGSYQTFLKKYFSVSLKKLFMCSSFAFHFLVSYTYSQTSVFIKFDVAIPTFKNLLNMAVLEERLNKTDVEKVV